MTVNGRLPAEVEVVVIGAGFAGVSVAASLARSGVGGGLVLERESLPGTHASGRNAAIARELETDPVLLRLAVEGVRRLHRHTVAGRPAVSPSGALYLFHDGEERAARVLGQLHALGVPSELLPADDARRRFPLLDGFGFGQAVFCPDDGVIDIHGLLEDLLGEARTGGFEIATACPAEDLIVESSTVRGVRTPRGTVAARIVVDASGAWAGRLGRAVPLPLQPLRRHLFFAEGAGAVSRDAPVVWDLDMGYYVRPEAAGVLLCACDESACPPCDPPVDPAVADLLVDKLLEHAPGLAEVALRRSWACLRTFAPDRLPVIGWDPEVSGLFHLSALGGFGATTSLAVGELGAARIRGAAVDWIDAGAFDPSREKLRPLA